MLSGFWINPRLNTTSLYSWTFIEFSFNSYAWYFELQEVCLHLRAWIIYKTTKWNKTHFWKTFMCMSRCHLLSVSSKLCLSLPEILGINICSFFLIRRRKLKYSLRRKKKKALPRHLLSIRMTKHDKRPINDHQSLITFYWHILRTILWTEPAHARRDWILRLLKNWRVCGRYDDRGSGGGMYYNKTLF